MPDVIGLQAITFALQEVCRLAPADRAGAIDRAGLGVREHASRVHRAWEGVPLPEGLLELLDDAQRAVRVAATLGTEWIVATDRLVAPSPERLIGLVQSTGGAGDLHVAPPGTVLFRGSPLAFASAWIVDDSPTGGVTVRECAPQRQVYRQSDGAGRPTCDVVRSMLDDLPAGQPLLVPVVEDGRVRRVFTKEDAVSRLRAQERVIGDTLIPVLAEG